MSQQDLKSGVFFGILAAFFFTLMGFWVKLLEPHVSISMVLFFRFGISLLVLFPFVIKKFPDLFKVKNPWPFVVRTLLNLISLGCFFQALKYNSFINTLVLVNMAPFFVPIITKILFKSKTHPTLWVGIGIGFLGVTFILHPDQEMLHFASSLAIISAILTALTISLLRAMTKVSSISQILFYNFFLATVITGIISIFTWEKLPSEAYLLLLGIGVCGALYQLCSTLSYSKVPVRISSSFMFLCILFGPLLDWAIFGLVPLKESVIGMSLVILGGLWIVYFGSRHIVSDKS